MKKVLPPENKKLFIKCECTSEGIEVCYDKEWKMFDICFWQYGHGGKTMWSYRLKYIWRILTKGAPYGDMVLMKHKDARKLLNFLKDNLDN